jgi:hypothetical protein
MPLGAYGPVSAENLRHACADRDQPIVETALVHAGVSFMTTGADILQVVVEQL